MESRDSVMMFQSYWESICDIKNLYGEERAGLLALELFHIGIYGERLHKFGYVEESIINGWLPLMERSKQSQDKAVQRNTKK